MIHLSPPQPSPSLFSSYHNQKYIMAFLFGRTRQKSPQDLVKTVRDLMGQMERPLEKRRVETYLLLSVAFTCNSRLMSSWCPGRRRNSPLARSNESHRTRECRFVVYSRAYRQNRRGSLTRHNRNRRGFSRASTRLGHRSPQYGSVTFTLQ